MENVKPSSGRSTARDKSSGKAPTAIMTPRTDQRTHITNYAPLSSTTEKLKSGGLRRHSSQHERDKTLKVQKRSQSVSNVGRGSRKRVPSMLRDLLPHNKGPPIGIDPKVQLPSNDAPVLRSSIQAQQKTSRRSTPRKSLNVRQLFREQTHNRTGVFNAKIPYDSPKASKTQPESSREASETPTLTESSVDIATSPEMSTPTNTRISSESPSPPAISTPLEMSNTAEMPSVIAMSLDKPMSEQVKDIDISHGWASWEKKQSEYQFPAEILVSSSELCIRQNSQVFDSPELQS